MVACAAGRSFNDVHEREIHPAQLGDNVLEQRLWLGILCIVGGGDWRETQAHAVSTNFLGDCPHDFQ